MRAVHLVQIPTPLLGAPGLADVVPHAHELLQRRCVVVVGRDHRHLLVADVVDERVDVDFKRPFLERQDRGLILLAAGLSHLLLVVRRHILRRDGRVGGCGCRGRDGRRVALAHVPLLACILLITPRHFPLLSRCVAVIFLLFRCIPLLVLLLVRSFEPMVREGRPAALARDHAGNSRPPVRRNRFARLCVGYAQRGRLQQPQLVERAPVAPAGPPAAAAAHLLFTRRRPAAGGGWRARAFHLPLHYLKWLVRKDTVFANATPRSCERYGAVSL